MNTYLTEIEFWEKTWTWPDIKANSFKEAENICLDNFKVIWIKISEQEFNIQI